MKLVLLPGMDGTGELFNPLLKHLSSDAIVLRLPSTGDQSYSKIAATLQPSLPDQHYVLLAESFSSGLVQYIVEEADEHLRGVVFVSGFVSPPSKVLLRLAKSLPLHALVNMPGFDSICKRFLLGRNASKESIDSLREVIKSVPQETLKKRLVTMLNMPNNNPFRCNIPCVCIVPTEDKLVRSKNSQELISTYRKAAITPISGPHFILQANPVLAAKTVQCAVNFINITNQTTPSHTLSTLH